MKYYWKKNKGLLAAALILGISASVLSTGVSLLLQRVIDAALSGQTALFGKLFIFTLVYILFLCLMNFLGALTSKYVTGKIVRQYRQDIFDGIIRRRPSLYFSENTANYVSAITNDIKLVEENYITALLNAFELVIMFTVTLGLLLYLSPLVTGILIATLLLMFFIPAAIGRLLEKRQASVSRQMSDFTEKLKDFFSGYEVIKSYSCTENVSLRFKHENAKEIHARFHAAKLLALNEGLSDTLSILSSITVIFVSAYLVLTGHLTMGTLLALVQLSSTFMAPVILLMQNIPKIQSMKTVITRLNQYISKEDLTQKAKPAPTFQREIELHHVSFSYANMPPLLSDITLTIEKGKKYAIMGQSGSGKSTLIKLLQGYFDTYQGSICYDGKELRSLNPDKIAELFAVIHQNVYLFNASIRENILLYQSYSETELLKALRKSGAAQFVSEKGLDYMVGENGASLSGGQKQRVTLARAFIRHAPILILDEATSALDQQTAHDIEHRLLKDPDITLLTITHNPSSDLLKQYDEIFDIKNGKLEKRLQNAYT